MTEFVRVRIPDTGAEWDAPVSALAVHPRLQPIPLEELRAREIAAEESAVDAPAEEAVEEPSPRRHRPRTRAAAAAITEE